ncbi:MAG: hypothetical protein JO146_04615, partial [Candidatus Eremiobacteraeota bacterium]|nr:hypothetical protein [Candidatus Eremiobacteraeota bacterium]
MGFAARTALLFALALSTLGANGNDTQVAGLLQRMSAAVGPVWRTRFVSVSRLTLGRAQNVVSTDGEGLRITVRHCTGELCAGTYFDGTHLYSVNINDTAVPQTLQPEPFLRALRLVESLQFLSPSFSAQGGRIAGTGDASFGGRRYHTFVVSAVNA